jgi:Putative prokaryotic signal transducing protein
VKTIFSSLDALEVHHLRNLLEADGIRTVLKNELLSRLAGEIPFTEVAMQIVVLRDEESERAATLLAGYRASRPAVGPQWRCAACGETIDPQFTACWRCGAERAA